MVIGGGEHGDAVLDWLGRDPAIALEQLGRPHLRRGCHETAFFTGGEEGAEIIQPSRGIDGLSS
jgi:hypothetical protein